MPISPPGDPCQLIKKFKIHPLILLKGFGVTAHAFLEFSI